MKHYVHYVALKNRQSSSAVEQVTVNHLVVGSIPTWTATEIENRNWQDFIPQFRFFVPASFSDIITLQLQ